MTLILMLLALLLFGVVLLVACAGFWQCAPHGGRSRRVPRDGSGGGEAAWLASGADTDRDNGEGGSHDGGFGSDGFGDTGGGGDGGGGDGGGGD